MIEERHRRSRREEGLTQEALTGYHSALDALESWDEYYYHRHPHSAIGYLVAGEVRAMHRTDYLGIHEQQYKRLRAEGEPGWGGKEGQFGGFLQWLYKAFQQEGVVRSGKLLELGCGDGSVTLQLAREGFEVYGIDISPTAISWAKEKAREQRLKGEFRLGNAVEGLPYPDDFFDVVIDGSCLHCIIGDDRKPFLSHTFRVLKPNGLFVVQTACGDPAEEGQRSTLTQLPGAL